MLDIFSITIDLIDGEPTKFAHNYDILWLLVNEVGDEDSFLGVKTCLYCCYCISIDRDNSININSSNSSLYAVQKYNNS